MMNNSQSAVTTVTIRERAKQSPNEEDPDENDDEAHPTAVPDIGEGTTPLHTSVMNVNESMMI